jgi:general stress protein 26
MTSNDDGSPDRQPDEDPLAVAREIVAKVKNCWLVTVASDGQANARVVAPIAGVPGDRDWTFWVLTSKGSRKVAEIRNHGRVTLGYQYDPESAYVTLVGHASIVNDRMQISKRWETSWNRVFAAEADDPDAIFLRIEVDRIELFNLARKITPAPFCKRCLVLVRDRSGHWLESTR